MATPAEEQGLGHRPGAALGRAARESAERAQQAALPAGRVVVSCSAPLGSGGLGRHLSEIVEALERSAQRPTCVCASTRSSDPRPPRHLAGVPYLADLLARSSAPVSPAIRTRAVMAEFDAYAAERLAPADHLIAFNGQALRQLSAARQAGYSSTSLVSANSHLRRVLRQHARARRQYPLEGSWAGHLLRRNLQEYHRADRILVASRYIRESFLEEGFPDELMSDFPLTPHPRFEPGGEHEAAGSFDIVYVGSLTVHKGVPLLIDAVRRLAHADIRLRLVGGWGTRGMRRFLQSACAADRRISIAPGDPLPHLQSARLCVHPAYEDGFGYAAAEALACGVPVIVSEDTGMKDLIEPGAGLILPTGDLAALTDAIDAAYRGEILQR
jgi:glycosyltransferase involved in cell wall biosynthesis